MTSKELITLLSEEGSTLQGTFYSMFSALSREQLNWKYDMRSWSIAECLDHLNITNYLYFPIIERAIHAVKNKPEFQENGDNFMHTLTGNMMIKMVKPENRKKSKAPKLYLPTQSQYDTAIAKQFNEQHKALIAFIDEAEGLNLAAVKVYSPVNKVFKFNLGDCFAMLIHHDRRHFEQMLRLRENPAFPLK
jgi:hypothetical protein